MEIKNRSLILSVGKPYNFIPDGETEALTGCKMYYVGTGNVAEIFFDEESKAIGYVPQKETMPIAFYEAAKEVGLPCYADITYVLKLTAKGTSAAIKSVEFIREDVKGGK